GRQALTVHRLTGAEAGDDTALGTLVAEGRTGEPVDGKGVRVWAGPAADPFYLDLRHLSHVLDGLQRQQPIEFGEWTEEQAASSFTGSEVNAIVLEIASTDDELRLEREIGVWAATKLATDAGGWQQVNRAAIPMMWPLFRAMGDSDDSAEYLRD